MKNSIGYLVVSLLMTSPAFAVSNYYYNCPHNQVKKTRVLELQFHSTLSTAPCQVIYHKPEKEPKVLWEAWNEEGYCESKGSAFAEKLKGWGWMCERVDDWYIPETAEVAINEMSHEDFEKALEKRKIQLKISGQKLEKRGLEQKAPKSNSADNQDNNQNNPYTESPSSTENPGSQNPQPGSSNKKTKSQFQTEEKTDWEKKMEELMKKKPGGTESE